MKVYVLTYQCIVDGCTEEDQTRVFADEIKALGTFKKWCDEEDKLNADSGWCTERSEHSYYAWLDGWSNDNHSHISCREIDVE